MTFDGRIGGNSPIFNFNKAGKANNASKAGEVKALQPIELVNTTQIDRTDLDKMSPYAKMGVNLSPKAPVGSVESYMAVAPEFNSWTGNFGISGEYRDEAVSLLDAYSRATLDFAEVSGNLQASDSTFAKLFT